MCEVKAHYEIERERDWTPRLRAENWPKRGLAARLAREKLRSYHLHILDAREAQVSIDRGLAINSHARKNIARKLTSVRRRWRCCVSAHSSGASALLDSRSKIRQRNNLPNNFIDFEDSKDEDRGAIAGFSS